MWSILFLVWCAAWFLWTCRVLAKAWNEERIGTRWIAVGALACGLWWFLLMCSVNAVLAAMGW